MNGHRAWKRWGWPIAGVVTALAIVVAAPQLGFTTAARPQLWTETAAPAAPVAAANEGWVKVARDLKPAVVNISTTRVEPGITEDPIKIPLADMKKIPAETLLLAVAGDQDTLVRDTDAKRIYYESTQVPAGNKDFITMVTDTHGMPSLQASHRAPTAMDRDYDNGEGVVGGGPANPRRVGNSSSRQNGASDDSRRLETMMVNALDYYGTWKLFDALCDAAFYGKNREYALGNTKEQRFMGTWSDGVPVKELKVSDSP